jgi:hypothetical protein
LTNEFHTRGDKAPSRILAVNEGHDIANVPTMIFLQRSTGRETEEEKEETEREEGREKKR